MYDIVLYNPTGDIYSCTANRIEKNMNKNRFKILRRAQSNLAKATSTSPLPWGMEIRRLIQCLLCFHTTSHVFPVHFKQNLTDAHSTRSQIAIIRISCIRCRLKLAYYWSLKFDWLKMAICQHGHWTTAASSTFKSLNMPLIICRSVQH